MHSMNVFSRSGEPALKYDREETVDMELNEEALPQVDAEYAEMNMLTILTVLLCGNIYTLVLVALPALTDVGSSHLNWYQGDDILRLIEPIGGFLFNFYVFRASGIFSTATNNTAHEAVIYLFLFGSAVYGQGAAFHSASAMFKHPVEDYYDALEPPRDEYLRDLLYWIRTVWEHIISHYMYAGGSVMMAAATAFVYRNVLSSRVTYRVFRYQQMLLILAALVYGVTIALVAIDFPSGIIVALLYLGLYGFCGVGGYAVCSDGWRVRLGHRPILHYYILSYAVAVIIIVVWIGLVGGVKSKSEAGM